MAEDVVVVEGEGETGGEVDMVMEIIRVTIRGIKEIIKV